MPLRTVRDGSGRNWEVWETRPAPLDRRSQQNRRLTTAEWERRSVAGVGVRPEFESGWLTFQTDGEKRRLKPVPENWYQLSDEDLLNLLHEAKGASPAPNVLD